MKGKVLITDYGFTSLEPERKILEAAGYQVLAAQCRTPEQVLQQGRDAAALLVQWAPVPGEVIGMLEKCRIIVRYGIGTDNVDLVAAAERGIAVCNVPDYCTEEVADHTLAMALSLGRQLQETDALVRAGGWKITPPRELPPFREMIFATAGFGRIARGVLKRAAAFGFTVAACDPYVPREEMEAAGVLKLEPAELWERSDVVSLHLPLGAATRHFVGESELKAMKPLSFLINTSRGLLVDTLALAAALTAEQIGGAALDVFEEEPLPPLHPLRRCPHVLLSPHAAWYSSTSGRQLQRKAAEEALRGLTGQPLKNRVN